MLGSTRSMAVALAVLLLGGCFQSRTTGDAGDDTGDTPTCGLTTPITFGYEGGMVRYTEAYSLSRDGVFVATRTTTHDGTITTCTTQIPPCDASDAEAVDIGDLESMFHRSEVRDALATPPPSYGYDPREVDGSVFAVRLVDGRGFIVGEDCGTRPSCTPIPLGVGALVSILQNLIEQELARPECAGLR